MKYKAIIEIDSDPVRGGIEMKVNRKRIVVGLAIVVGLLLSGFVGYVTSTHGSEAEAARDSSAPTPGVEESWWSGVGSAIFTPILVDFGGDQNIEIIVCDNTAMRCYQWSGELLWTVTTGGAIHNSPTVVDLDGDGEVEVTVFSEEENALIAVNSHGQRIWNYQAGQGVIPGGAFGSTAHHSAPSGDLYGNGKCQSLVVPQNMNVQVFNYDGTNLGAGDINQVSLGWHSSPVITDLDDTNKTKEYVCAGNNGQLIAVNAYGQQMWVWSGNYGGWEESSPGAGDINGDGYSEIFGNTEVNGGHSVVCVSHDGQTLWTFDGGGSFYSSPAAADLDGDGYYEVISACMDGYVYVLNGTDGSVKWKHDLGYKIKPSPAVGDVNSDGILDVIEVNSRGKLFALDGKTGNEIWSFDPNAASDIPDSSIVGDPSPVVGDINSDGYLDILFSDGDGVLHVVGTNGSVAKSALTWPMFRYCKEHTGYYNGTLEYGVIVKPDEDVNDPSPFVHKVDPGNYTTFYLELMNVGHQSRINGLLKDKFSLSIDNSSMMLPGWTASLYAYGVPVNPGPPTDPSGTENQDFIDVKKIENVQLKEQESIKLQLRVSAPYSPVHYGDHVIVNLTAQSWTDPNATDFISTMTVINITVDFDVKFNVNEDPFTGIKKKTIDAGEKMVVETYVRNLGNMNDTIYLNLSIDAAGWKAYFDPNSEFRVSETRAVVNLSAPYYGNGLQTITVFIESPETAMKGDIAEVTLEGESQEAENVGIMLPPKDDTLRLEVLPSNLLDIYTDEDTLRFDPGEIKYFDVVVKNKGNSQITVHLNLLGAYNDPNSGYVDPTMWNASIESSSHTPIDTINLGINQAQHIYVMLQAPYKARADSRIVMTVKGFVATQQNIKDSVDLTGIVNRISGVAVKVQDGSMEVSPGKAANYTVVITNTGNADDNIHLSPTDIPTGWNYTFYEDGYPVTDVSLGPDEFNTIVVSVRPTPDSLVDADPDDEEITPYKLIFNASVSDVYTQFSMLLSIKQVYDVSIKPMDVMKMTSPGSTVTFLLEITNNGNWIDTVNLSKDNIPGDWDYFIDYVASSRVVDESEGADFGQPIKINNAVDLYGNVIRRVELHNNATTDPKSISIVMAPGQVVYVSVAIETSMNSEKKTYDMSFKVGTSGQTDLNPDDNNALFHLGLATSDIIVTKVVFPKDIEDGQLVTIKVYVKNIGDIEAENVKVEVKIGDKVIGETTVNTIVPGDTKIATFIWRADTSIAKEGNGKISVIADPDHTLAENDENNNELDAKINVKSKGILGIPGFDMWAAMAGMLAALSISIMLSRRRL